MNPLTPPDSHHLTAAQGWLRAAIAAARSCHDARHTGVEEVDGIGPTNAGSGSRMRGRTRKSSGNFMALSILAKKLVEKFSERIFDIIEVESARLRPRRDGRCWSGRRPCAVNCGPNEPQER